MAALGKQRSEVQHTYNAYKCCITSFVLQNQSKLAHLSQPSLIVTSATAVTCWNVISQLSSGITPRVMCSHCYLCLWQCVKLHFSDLTVSITEGRSDDSVWNVSGNMRANAGMPRVIDVKLWEEVYKWECIRDTWAWNLCYYWSNHLFEPNHLIYSFK